LGAPLGNSNFKGEKIWRDAVMRAVKRSAEGDDKQHLERLADMLVAKALQGDISALKEIGDRIDGRPAQAIDATVNQVDPAAEARSKEIMHRLIARFDEVVAIRRAEARAAGLIVDVMPQQRITNGHGNGVKKPNGNGSSGAFR
jgi:hypothetical protein